MPATWDPTPWIVGAEVLVGLVLIARRDRIRALRHWPSWAALAVLALGLGFLPRYVGFPGAAAQCRDGWYSYSGRTSGTCSGHGGVGRWINLVPAAARTGPLPRTEPPEPRLPR